ncbi:MAG: DUF5681 domain-containing protein [Brevundimonas sp.]|nr:DUF5681 domain-containing protein [Brevundimonas sp.]
MASDDENEVGYGKPPKASRFKPGQSGNPKGRPKKVSAGLADHLREAVNQKLEVKVGGVRKTMTFQEAIATKLANEALTGSASDMIRLLSALQKYAPDVLMPAPDEKNREVTIHIVKPDANGQLMKYDGDGNPVPLSKDDIRRHSKT